MAAGYCIELTPHDHSSLMMKRYNAPWSATLVTVSLLAAALCLAITFGIWPMVAEQHVLNAFSWLGLVPLALVVGCALFTIRGYTITPDAILVHRLFWATRVPRAGLQSARFEPNAMHGSIRLFGNGGLFSFTGFYRNKLLGSYRAFVTDQHGTVVLRYAHRTIVLSPESPEAFAQELGTAN
jgi:hypothetical protein